VTLPRTDRELAYAVGDRPPPARPTINFETSLANPYGLRGRGVESMESLVPRIQAGSISHTRYGDRAILVDYVSTPNGLVEREQEAIDLGAGLEVRADDLEGLIPVAQAVPQRQPVTETGLERLGGTPAQQTVVGQAEPTGLEPEAIPVTEQAAGGCETLPVGGFWVHLTGEVGADGSPMIDVIGGDFKDWADPLAGLGL